MRVEIWVLGSGAFFFVPLAFVYGLLSGWEYVGFIAILLTGGLSAMIGLYLYLVSLRVDARPEDDPVGEVSQGAGDLGFFNPRSVWPIGVAAGGAVVFAGMAVGVWLFLIGLGILLITSIGLLFEHYVGDFEH
ncbi:cytochrome c oxidase subunit 4 [Aquipuribacter sp. MA13-6]|uniref:cytochrome c oxidase subunit 4 n=1 Tax=unclassified Aquipuribacter TaxID=2635084 RepID=UPI003EF00F4E